MSLPAPRQGPPKFVNRIIGVLLHVPIATPLSRSLALVTFTGSKSGKRFTTPVGYMRQGTIVSIFTDHTWWKNMQTHPNVSLVIAGKTLAGTAEVIHDDTNTIEQELWTYVQQNPGAARAYGVERDAAGKLDRASVHSAAQRFTLMRIHLK